MLDLREDLQSQALGAIRGHAQSTVEPTRQQLETIAAGSSRQNARFFSSTRLRDFARAVRTAHCPKAAPNRNGAAGSSSSMPRRRREARKACAGCATVVPCSTR
jgi:hypothetical protein